MCGSGRRNECIQAGFENRPRCRACYLRLINALFGSGYKNVSCHRWSQVRSAKYLQILTKAISRLGTSRHPVNRRPYRDPARLGRHLDQTPIMQ
jgi:hypothetical protein